MDIIVINCTVPNKKIAKDITKILRGVICAPTTNKLSSP